MGIYAPLREEKVGCNWPSSWLSVTVETWVSCWTRTSLWCWDAKLIGSHLCWNTELTGSRWSWNVKFFRLVFVVKYEASHARIFMLKRVPEVCILKSNWPSPLAQNARFAFEIGTRPRHLTKDVRSASEVEMWPLSLTKDVKSAFGLKHNPRVWHEACIWDLVFSNF